MNKPRQITFMGNPADEPILFAVLQAHATRLAHRCHVDPLTIRVSIDVEGHIILQEPTEENTHA